MVLLLCMYIYSIINLFIAWGSCVGPGGMFPTISPDGNSSVCHAMFQSVQFISDLLQHQLTSILRNCPPEMNVMVSVRLHLSLHAQSTYMQPQQIMSPICLVIMSSGIKRCHCKWQYCWNRINNSEKKTNKHMYPLPFPHAKLSEEIKY